MSTCQFVVLNMEMAPSSVQKASLLFVILAILWSYRLGYWDPRIVQSAQDFKSESSQKRTSHRKSTRMWIHELTLCAELPPASQGGLCVLSEDGVSSGEAGGQPARLPQLLLPLLALQHQTEVRTTQMKKTQGIYWGFTHLKAPFLKGQFTPKSRLHIFMPVLSTVVTALCFWVVHLAFCLSALFL